MYLSILLRVFVSTCACMKYVHAYPTHAIPSNVSSRFSDLSFSPIRFTSTYVLFSTCAFTSVHMICILYAYDIIQVSSHSHYARYDRGLLYISEHCNTPQHTATHCNALHRTETCCNTLQHTAAHCNILQHAAIHCIYISALYL